MKKILFITGDQSRSGGTERICAAVANMFVENKFCVDVLSLSGDAQSYFPLHPSVRLTSLKLDECKGLKLLFIAPIGIGRHLNRNKYSSIIVVESLLFIFVTPYCLINCSDTKVINWEHFNYDVSLGVRSRVIARWLASKLANHIVVITESDKKKWQLNLSIPDSKISQIYNLNPFDNFKNKTFNIDDDSKVILAAGRLTHQKGFDLLISSWSKIPEEKRFGWSLRIVGEGEDRVALQDLIRKFQLESSVRLAGIAINMEQEYRAAAAFVLSSRFEGFGLVLTEALSVGTPVISFDCPDGPAEIIYNFQNGILVKHNDINSLAGALVNFITSRSLRSHLKENTNKGLERFSSDAVLSQWLSLV